MVFLFSNERVKPLSISNPEKAINRASAPINPYSDGSKILIRTMLVPRLISCWPNLSAKLQKRETVVFFVLTLIPPLEVIFPVITAKVRNFLYFEAYSIHSSVNIY